MFMSMLRRSKIRSEGALDDPANEITVQTKNLNNEIVSLSSQTSLKEEYIGDVEESLKLNKQAANIMFYEQAKRLGRDELLHRFDVVARENMRLLEEMTRHRLTKEDATAELLIKEQIRTQDEEFFLERIGELDNRVDEMRKTFQDKEYNYFIIAQRLSIFEEIEENFITCVSHSHNAALAEKIAEKVIRKLSRDKQQLKEEIDGCRSELRRLRLEDADIKAAVQRGLSFQQLKRKSVNNEDNKSDGEEAPFVYTDNNVEDFVIPQDLGNPYPITAELLKLLKKQKTARHVLRLSIKDAVETDTKLRQSHKRLLEKARQFRNKLSEHQDQIKMLESYFRKRVCPHQKFKEKHEHQQHLFRREAEPIHRRQFDENHQTSDRIDFTAERPRQLLIRSGSEPLL